MDVPDTPAPKLEADKPPSNAGEQKPPTPEQHVDLPSGLVRWLKVVPVFAVLISLVSLGVSIQSCRFAMGYARPNEDHDVVAKVLGVRTLLKGFGATTNAELRVDIAVINRGNQKEIIRDGQLCYSDTQNMQSATRTVPTQFQDVLLDKGEKRVLHLVTPFNEVNTGKRLWLGVEIRAVAPNADDILVTWPVCQIELAADGNGAWVSYNKDQTPIIHIISNQRQSNQRLAPDGM